MNGFVCVGVGLVLCVGGVCVVWILVSVRFLRGGEFVMMLGWWVEGMGVVVVGSGIL